MKLKLLAGAAFAAVFAASGAHAGSPDGWYGAVDVGYHAMDGLEGASSNAASNGVPYRWTWFTDNDWTGFARLGYRFNPNWRLELEGGYRKGDLRSVRARGSQTPAFNNTGLCAPGIVRTAGAPACGSPTGKVDAWTGMVNVLYDIMPSSKISPFVGVGLGVNRVSIKTS